MITSAKLLTEINSKIATLRTEIAQSGKLGLTDIHKQCENFIKHLLNRTLAAEILALIKLLIFSKQLYGRKKFQIDLDFELRTSNKLSLIPQNSPLHLINYSSWPVLNPSPSLFPGY